MRRAIRLFKFKGLKKLSTTKHSEASHIFKLPPELLAIIFEIGTLLSYQNGRELKTNSTYPLIISSVCCLWRNVALNIVPAMWSTIVIHPNRTLDLPLLYLGRSGDMLLDITLGSPQDFSVMRNIKIAGVSNCLDLIMQYSHRWRYLKLRGSEFPNTSDVLRSVRAPYLTKLILNSRYGDHVSPMFIDNGAPMLSHLSLYGMAKCCGQPTRFLSVQTLCLSRFGLDMDNVEFSSFLESFPSLQRFTMQTSGPETMMTPGQKPVTLPNLVELTLSRDLYGSLILGLLAFNLRVPLLRVVNLSVFDLEDQNFWESFGSYPKSLPSVEKFTILWTSDLFVPTIFPNVRDLDLGQDVERPQAVSASEDLAFEHARYWPSLEKLTIRRWGCESDDRCLINFAKGLLKWHGRRIQEIKTIGYDISFDSVERLKEAFREFEVPLFVCQ